MTTRLLKSSENINGLPIGFQEVEYLQSSGTQYIDMGVGVKANTVFKAIFSVASTATGRSYFGARNSSNERFQIVNSIGIGGGYYLVNTVYPIADKKYEIEMRASGEMYLDGVKRNASTGTFSQVSFERNLWLFATNYYDSSVGPGASTFWKVQIFEGDTLVRDLIPALNPAGRPCMYDLVEKKAYYNIGTGEFTYGRKIIPVEYLESTGTQYIDTGIKGKNNIDFDYKVNFTNVTTSSGYGIGGEWESQKSLYLGLIRSNGNFAYHYANTNAPVVVLNSVNANTDYSIQGHMWSGEQYMVINGTKSAVGTITGTFESTQNIALFRVTSSSPIYCYAKIYYCKIWDSAILIRDLIPCIDENNVPFMFDKVTHTCYLNAGTGTFNYGKKLYSSKVRLYKDSEANKLPIGFKRVEYLESTGTQYIDTGIKFNCANTKIELKTYEDSLTRVHSICGDDGNCFYYFRGTGNWAVGYNNTSSNVSSYMVVGDNVFVIDKNKVYLNGVLTTTYTASSTISSYNALLFNRKTSLVDKGAVTMYYCKIWDNDTLVRNFIPALDTTNTPCMYDTVTQTAFYNQGAGEFTYGAVIPNKLRLPQSTEIRFPKGYTEVEYIQSSGTQYIDTEYKPIPATTKFEFMFSPDTVSGNSFLFGCRPDTSIGAFTCTTYFATGSVRQDWAGLNTYFPTTTANSKYLYSAYNNTINLNTDSVTSTTTRSTERLNLNFLLFSVNTNGTADDRRFVGKVYYSRLWDNGALVRNFIPCLDPNGRPCLWDTVTKKPYYNQGTGEFSYGRTIQQVEYLESSGTQYINTGYVPTDTTGVEVKHTICADNSYDNIVFGCRENSLNTRFWEDVDWTQSDSIGWGFNEYSNNISGYRCPLTSDMIGQTIISSFNFMNDRACKVDGVSYDPSIATKTLATITKPMYLFGANNQGNFGYANACKVFYMNVSENQKVVMKLVPAIDSNNVGFMFDRVTHTIFDNKGTGSFTYGSPVPNKIRN